MEKGEEWVAYSQDTGEEIDCDMKLAELWKREIKGVSYKKRKYEEIDNCI